MVKNKIKLFCSVIIILMMYLAGCSANYQDLHTNTDNNETQIYSFKDDLGREVTIASHERVATLIGSFADIWMLSGGKLTATAADTWESFELNLDDSVINLGSLQKPNAELIIAAQPDFVIASSNIEAHVELEPILSQAGITVAYFCVNQFEDYLHMLDICTNITGRKDLYQKNGVEVESHIQEVLKRVDGSSPKILFLRASTSGIKVKGSNGTVGGEILKSLGSVNIADRDKSMLDTLSLESIIVANPDYIFLTYQGSDIEKIKSNVEKNLTSNPAWSSLKAVQNGQYYILDKRLYNQKPNARWGEAYEKLADILYPDNM